jgi:ATP-dependent RNA helicase RhlE
VAFGSLPLNKSLLQALKELGFLHPTAIQTEAIPPALEGRDMIACAATGSGKTAAFLLPILHQLLDKPRGGVRVLVLTPTRELAAQTLETMDNLAVHTPLTAAAVYGGVSAGPQERAFRAGTDVLIATPGRLLDHLKQSYASLAKVEHLVLDEADRMLDMGFLPEIRKILKHIPAKRQTLMFSATMPDPIRALANDMLTKPLEIATQRKAAPASGITQAIYPVAQELKGKLLFTLLDRGDLQEVLVFTRTKHRANRLSEFLVTRGINAERIHGNRSQLQRQAALDGFKKGTIRVLVATDIAARGIDVTALEHVVNFDVPLAPEDYIHRVGRTGRAEATGEAYTFMSPEEEGEVRDIERSISKRLPRVTVTDFDYAAKPDTVLEVPLKERIAAIRAQKADDRKRSTEKAARKAAGVAEPRRGPGTRNRGPQPGQGGAPARSSEGAPAPRPPRSGGSGPSGAAGSAMSSRLQGPGPAVGAPPSICS